MRRLIPAGVVLAVFAAGATACDLEDVPGLGGGSPASSPTAGKGPGQAAGQRIQPTYPNPVTYRPAKTKRFEITYLNASVKFANGPVEYRLGFRVDGLGDSDGPQHSLLKSNLKTWYEQGVKPERFSVDGGTGYRVETPEPGGDGIEPGTQRFAIVAKGSVAVTVSAFAPKGTQLTDEHRRIVDRLVQSLKFDTGKLTGSVGNVPVQKKQPLRAAQPVPVVPFSYERPPELTGGEQAEGGYGFYTRLRTTSAQTVNVQIYSHPKAGAAHAAYLKDKRKLESIRGANPKDVKTRSATRDTLGRQVDEGFGLAVKEKGIPGYVIEEFKFRKGRLVVSVNASERNRPLSLDTLEAIAAVITTFAFTREAL